MSERAHVEADTVADTAARALAFATGAAEDFARGWPFALPQV